MIFLLLFFSERATRGGGGRCQTLFFLFSLFSDHERDWPACKVVFFGLASNALNVRNNNMCNNNNKIELDSFRNELEKIILFFTHLVRYFGRRAARRQASNDRDRLWLWMESWFGKSGGGSRRVPRDGLRHHWSE